MEKNLTTDTYKLVTNNLCANLAVMALIALVTCIVPLLLNNGEAILFYTSLPFYITVVILFGCVVYFGYWALLIGFFSFAICGYVLDLPVRVWIVNALINTLQVFLIIIGYRGIQKIALKYPGRNRNRYAEGIFYLSSYNALMVLCGVLYFVFCSVYPEDLILSISVFAAVVLIATVTKIIVNRDIFLLSFLLLIAVLPSLVCSGLSAWCSDVPQSLLFEYIHRWAFSNFILLQTFGYLIYQVLYKQSFEKRHVFTGKEIVIDLGILAYYIAMLLWNLLMIFLFYSDIFNNSAYLYFPPWILGNVLFGANLYFSFANDAGNEKNRFSWYEKRVIVVEKNTSIIITIIAFVLPLSASLIKGIPDTLRVLFVADIFCACMSVGLIWIPKSNLKFIALLKSLKTIFYLYAVSLLLIAATAIVFSK